MQQFEVIRYFTDAQDKEYAYHEGDIYPRAGLSVSEKRIKELLSGNNFQRVPLIKRTDKVAVEKKVEEPKQVEETQEVSYTAADIKKMPYMKLKSVAKQNGIDVKDKEASEIRSELIEKLEL